MKARQEVAVIERAPFTDFSISDIISRPCVSLYTPTSYLFRAGDLDARGFEWALEKLLSREHIRNLSASTRGSWLFARPPRIFDLRGIASGNSLRVATPGPFSNETGTCEEVNYPFSEVFLSAKKSRRKDRPAFRYRIHYGRALLIAIFNFLSVDTSCRQGRCITRVLGSGIEAGRFNENYKLENQ